MHVFRTILLAGLSSAAWAGMIGGDSINYVSGEAIGAPWDLAAIHLLDGSGLTGDVHGDCYATNTCWQNGFGGAVPAIIIFDLGASYTLTSMHIWNGYWANYQSGRGANQVEISTSGDLLTWDARGTFTFPEAPVEPASYTGFTLDSLGWAGAQYVRFQIDSNYGGGDCGSCISMNEVQFFSDSDGQVPEPASIALVAAGLAAGFLFRARRRGAV